jgi:hypothetical protein
MADADATTPEFEWKENHVVTINCYEYKFQYSNKSEKPEIVEHNAYCI